MLRVCCIWMAVFLWCGSAMAQEEEPTVIEPQKVPGEKGDPLDIQIDKNFRLGKIHEFVNDPSVTRVLENIPVGFEFKYINHGAITKEQKRQRRGHYFLVHWENNGSPANVIVRFDYRQEGRREEVKTLEIEYPVAQGSNKAKFQVLGESYEHYGKVHSWKLSIVKDDVVVAEKKSFVW